MVEVEILIVVVEAEADQVDIGHLLELKVLEN